MDRISYVAVAVAERSGAALQVSHFIFVGRKTWPLAHEARAGLSAIAEGRKAVAWVGLEYRYMPPVSRLIDEVRSGRLGKLRMLSIREHRFPFLEKVGNWNRFSRRTGSPRPKRRS